MGKQARVSYFDRIAEGGEQTPKGSRVMSFDTESRSNHQTISRTEEDEQNKSSSRVEQSNTKSHPKNLQIDVDETGNDTMKSHNLTPNNRSKNGLMECNMSNNAYYKN